MEIDAPEAPVVEENAPAVDDESPAGGEATAPSAAETETQTPESAPQASKPVISKEERDRRAAEGRQRAEERKNQKALQDKVDALTQQVSTLVAGLSAQQQQQREAYVASLEPEEQVAFLRQELAAARTPQPVQQNPTGEQEAYRQAREHLAELNEQLGLTGTPLEVKGNEPVISTRSQDAWYASVDALAHARAETLEERAVPAKKQEETPDIQALIKAEVQRATGVGRSNAATPASGGNADITSKQIKDLAAMGSARNGFKTMRSQVEKNLEAYVRKHPPEELAARAREQSNY